MSARQVDEPVKLCVGPSAALNFVPAATLAFSVQVPMPTTVTVFPDTMHTEGVDEVTEVVPSPVVDTIALNEVPTFQDVGRFAMITRDDQTNASVGSV